jgi:hypothetical protein
MAPAEMKYEIYNKELLAIYDKELLAIFCAFRQW